MFPTRHPHPRPVARRLAIGAMGLASTSLATVGLGACGDGDAADDVAPIPITAAVTAAVGGSTSQPAGGALTDQLASMPVGDLSDDEREALLYMIEEEKLARDVYTLLADTWGTRVFSNIADAEQTHTDAVAALLTRYGVPLPTTNDLPGVFTDPDLQLLYDQLVAQGTTSLVDALTVGATIEEVDIADLRARAGDDPDIQMVFDNLERGSRNHLRAFVGQLADRGASYTPVHISQADFDTIVSSGTERGHP